MTKLFKPKNIDELKDLQYKLEKSGYKNLSGGTTKLMNLDKKWYKGVTAIIVKYPKTKNYFLYYVNYRSFLQHGHRFG